MGGAASDDKPASAQEAVQQMMAAKREQAVCETEIAKLAEQGNASAGAEAAQDAQEWVEYGQGAKAALIFYLSNC